MDESNIPQCSHTSDQPNQPVSQNESSGNPERLSDNVGAPQQIQPGSSKEGNVCSNSQPNNVEALEQNQPESPKEDRANSKRLFGNFESTQQNQTGSSKNSKEYSERRLAIIDVPQQNQTGSPKAGRSNSERRFAIFEVPQQNQLGTPKISKADSDRLSGNVSAPLSFCVARIDSTTLSYCRNNSYLSPYGPLKIRSSVQSPITTQPRFQSDLPSPASIILRNQPQTLFMQALTKLNESSITNNFINHLRMLQSNSDLSKIVNFDMKSGEITPPDSLTSAPPSYSFVLRQMAVRRRPRLMGTFIPSPSFVQHTPPPTYTTAFDVYIEPLPPPPPRVYTFGFTSMPIVCPECGFTGMTVVTSKTTICTHLCALILCLFCCWICSPLPYVLRSCKDVYHYCRNCRRFLGMYCPTNPDGTYQ